MGFQEIKLLHLKVFIKVTLSLLSSSSFVLKDYLFLLLKNKTMASYLEFALRPITLPSLIFYLWMTAIYFQT